MKERGRKKGREMWGCRTERKESRCLEGENKREGREGMYKEEKKNTYRVKWKSRDRRQEKLRLREKGYMKGKKSQTIKLVRERERERETETDSSEEREKGREGMIGRGKGKKTVVWKQMNVKGEGRQ